MQFRIGRLELGTIHILFGAGAILIPLLVAVYVIAAFFGFVAVSAFLEEVLTRGFRLSARQGGGLFVVAALIVSLVRMIPFLGEILTVVISLLGFGAAVLTRFGTAESRPTILRISKEQESTPASPAE